jgi:prephenate dehydrogenase
MSVQITIIGLNRIGASIGLALASQKQKIVRFGHDREPETMRKAQKLGAVDQTSFNLPASAEKADAVVLAVPVDEIHLTLESIAPVLKPGAVVIDTSPLIVPVTQWAVELLPPERYFVTMTPSLNPAYINEADQETPHADLFQNSLAIITGPAGVDEDAMKLATDLATLLGANPLFADPYEADGLLAATHLLPKLAAAALVQATVSQPGWNEARKVAGQAYAVHTSPVKNLDENKGLGQSALHNRENALRVLDNLIASLQTLRGHIEANDQDALTHYLEEAQIGRETWWQQRLKSDWTLGEKPPEAPSTAEIYGRLIGLGRKREPKDKDKDRK